MSESFPSQNLSVDQPLGESLRKIGAITPNQLRKGLTTSAQTGLPLGWVLLSQGSLIESLLNSAISAQSMIQKQALNEEQALNLLRIARLKQKDFGAILSQHGIDKQAILPELLLAQLLVKSDIALNSEVLACRELATMHDTAFTQVLSDCGILEEWPLAAVADVFSKINKGVLRVNQGIAILQKLKAADWDVDSVDKHHPTHSSVDIIDLLGMASLLTNEQLRYVQALSISERRPLSKTLVDAGFFSEIVIGSLEECKTFLNANLLSLDKAQVLVSYCADNQCTFADAQAQFGWTPVTSVN